MSRFEQVLEDLIWIDLLDLQTPKDCNTSNDKERESEKNENTRL